MSEADTALPHHRNQIAKAQFETQVPGCLGSMDRKTGLSKDATPK